MPKNTLLFVSFLAVIAALLVGIQIGRSMTPQQVAVAPSPTPVITAIPTLHSVNGSSCGVRFQYPSNLTAMEGSGSGMILANKTKPEESIVIVCQDEIPRVALPDEKIDVKKILSVSGSASVSAKLYHDASQKDGTPMDKLIFTHPKTNQDVFIGGYGVLYTQLLDTLTLE